MTNRFFQALWFPLLSALVLSSCGSNKSFSHQIYPAVQTQTAVQKNQEISTLSQKLAGTWVCTGMAGGIAQPTPQSSPQNLQNFTESTDCSDETLTFDQSMNQVVIQDYWSICLMNTTYQLTVQSEDSDGNTEFTLHANQLGTLVSSNSTSRDADCKLYVNSLPNAAWNENLSLTHDANWTTITIDEANFSRKSASAPMPNPSAS